MSSRVRSSSGPTSSPPRSATTRAQALPPVSLDVPQIKELNSAREGLNRYVARGCLRGDRADPPRPGVCTRGAPRPCGIIGVGFLAAAVLLVTVGYLVPVRAVPALSSEPWLAVVPDIAHNQQPVLIAVTVVLVGAGLACLAGAGLLARRRTYA